MHIYFSGIGGTGIGPLALIAHEAGFEVSGSDKQDSNYISYLKDKGITDINIDQSYEAIAAAHKKHPIDWLIYTSALPIEQPDAPEIRFARENGIRSGKRDDLINVILKQKKLKLIAIAGTHGKTTTTSMVIWLFKCLRLPVSYSVGAKIGFGEMGEYDSKSKYFVYEADEFDRNFLNFKPYLSVITGVDWDHHDIYPTRDDYNEAFKTFLNQSMNCILWESDAKKLELGTNECTMVLSDEDKSIGDDYSLFGIVNRRNGFESVKALRLITGTGEKELAGHMNNFPGVYRRFEEIIPGLHSDYAHTPPKIRGALQMAREVAGNKVVVVYEGLHNTRQHFIKDQLKTLFEDIKKVYVVPSYLAREDKNLKLLTPADIIDLLEPETRKRSVPSELNGDLYEAISRHLKDGDLVICLSAGGGGSLDEWLRKKFSVAGH